MNANIETRNKLAKQLSNAFYAGRKVYIQYPQSQPVQIFGIRVRSGSLIVRTQNNWQPLAAGFNFFVDK